MSFDMFPDPAIDYLLENANSDQNTPEEDFVVDLDAVQTYVETELFPINCDEVEEITVTAGLEPFVLLSLHQVEGENALTYRMVGSFLDEDADLLQTLQGFVDVLTAKIEADVAEAERDCSCGALGLDIDCVLDCDGEVINRQRVDDIVGEYLDEELTRANEDATIRDMGGK